MSTALFFENWKVSAVTPPPALCARLLAGTRSYSNPLKILCWPPVRWRKTPEAFVDPLLQAHSFEKLDALLSQTRRLESLYQRKIEELDALKKSLLEQAFKGEL